MLAVVAMLAAACQPTAPPPPSPDARRAQVFAGLGAWWDVWDWSPTWVRSRNPAATPPLGLSDVSRLADAGVQTLYVQPSTFRHPAVVLDRALLLRIIDRAHAEGMRVVGWYLPEFVDLQLDLDRMVAIAQLPVDGLGIDIESTTNADVAQRSERLITETRFMRGHFPNLPLAAITLPPVALEDINPALWPNFPYRTLSGLVDVWMPMAYWSYRSAESGWRDPYLYVAENVRRLRARTGRPGLHVAPIGGEAATMTTTDVFWMNAAMTDTGAIGGSIYDDASTPAPLWDALHLFRREIVK